MKYTIENIDDYQKRLTDEQKVKLVEHCNNYNIFPEICAWYDDMNDFYQDWIIDNSIFKTKNEANERYYRGVETGEFLKFNDGQIVRLVL